MSIGTGKTELEAGIKLFRNENYKEAIDSLEKTFESKNYNIVIGGDVVSVGDAKATFKDGGYLTIVFKWGGSSAEITFQIR